MNHALVFVLIAVAGGLASLLALEPVAPHLGPAVALAVTAAALLGGSLLKDHGSAHDSQASTAPVDQSSAPL